MRPDKKDNAYHNINENDSHSYNLIAQWVYRAAVVAIIHVLPGGRLSSLAEPPRCSLAPRLVGKEKIMWKLGLLWAKFRRELILAWTIVRDVRTPASAKLATIAAVLYVISPIDLVPDFIPILGWLDDGLIAVLLLKLAQKLLPADLLASLKATLDQRSGQAKPK